MLSVDNSAISLELCGKPYIVWANDFLGACSMLYNAMTPKTLRTLLPSPQFFGLARLGGHLL